MQGTGAFTYEDGRQYEGEYFADKKHGHGVFQWPNGRLFDGNWVNGKEEGAGILFNSVGEVRYGIWVNGKRTKWIKEEEFHHHSFIEGAVIEVCFED